MAVWPVFLALAMYQDHGNHFAIGDVVAWEVLLVADFWNPAIPTTIVATILGIEVVSWRAAIDPSGVWMPLAPWRLTPAHDTPPLHGLDPRDPGAEHAGGLLFSMKVSSCAVRASSEIGRGLGDPAAGPGLVRTRPRRRAESR